MNLAANILDAALAFLVLFFIFRPLEIYHPAKPNQRFFRSHWFTDLCYLLGQYLLFNTAVFWLLQRAEPHLRSATPAALRNAVAALPLWSQALLVIFLGDLLIYWAHRLQHRVGFLWRFHAVHHSSEHLDWLAAHREHPVDSLYTILIVNLPVFALGFPIASLATFAAFRGIWAIYIHANVRLPIGPLRLLIGAPELHHWHHARDRDAGNYANVSPLMDLLFGTYHHPGHEPPAVGITDPMPTTYLGQLLHPFRPNRPGVPAPTRSPAMSESHATPSNIETSPSAGARP